MSEERLDEVLDAAGLKSYTEHTLTSREALLEQLAQVRVEGFATAYEELETGLNAAAVPVRDHTGSDHRRPERIRAGLPLRQGTDRVRRRRPQDGRHPHQQRMGWLG